MTRLAAAASLAALLATSAAVAQSPPSSTQPMSNVPRQSVTMTDWYKQDVYDPSNNKIGEVMDVLVSPEGKVSALIVGVGGFLGMGEKDVAVPFDAIKHTARDNKVYLTMDTTKDALKAAPGFTYDRNTTAWVPDTGKSNSGAVKK
jgi:sporulation protein YlmC with PRC-barrel domain